MDTRENRQKIYAENLLILGIGIQACVVWDGCNGVGDEALNGVYIYKITAVDNTNTRATDTGKLLKLK